MPRWLIGTATLVYLAGTYGFGLERQVSGVEVSFIEAMAYGASWPVHTLRLLNLL